MLETAVREAVDVLGTSVVKTVAINLVSAVMGGVLLALLFFVLKEKWFSLPEIAGRWYFETRTEKTAYRPYLDMKLTYVAILWREGHVVYGTVEKIHEDSSTGKIDYVGPKRTRGEVRGYIEKKYMPFSRDRLFLHIVEDRSRESTYYHELTFRPRRSMDGKFISMVADQDGSVSWQRDRLQHS